MSEAAKILKCKADQVEARLLELSERLQEACRVADAILPCPQFTSMPPSEQEYNAWAAHVWSVRRGAVKIGNILRRPATMWSDPWELIRSSTTQIARAIEAVEAENEELRQRMRTITSNVQHRV